WGRGRMPRAEPQLPLVTLAGEWHFAGEAVAVVVAETAAQARDAADLVEVDYDLLPAATDVCAALEPEAPSVWTGAPDNVLVDADFGDRAATQAALDASAVTVELRLRNQRIVSCQLEPRSVLASY